MAQITFKGNPVNTISELPKIGSHAPDFVLTRTDLSDMSMNDLKGKKVVMNIFPSVDTPVCAASVRRFNKEAASIENVVVLCISLDLPFALGRFCGAEGLDDVVPVSELRGREFGNLYGVRISDGPLAGLLARAVVILNETGNVVYTELVPEIAEEPDYEKALSAVR